MQSSEPYSGQDQGPKTIGRYEIVCKLGVGGMADVFLAHQPGPFSAGKLVVIKQLRTGVTADEQFLQMFADESRIAVRLNHPNVAHTYEVVAERDEYFLTLEFLDGKPLHQVLRRVSRERMPLDLHLWVLSQVLAGLHYAHELRDFDGSPMGIVHRDVSPSNVFVTYSGEVKLLDFGIAKSVGAISSTREGIVKGKLGYAAPEQCLCAATDARTDVYAVGVMLWEAIAGRRRALGETEAGAFQSRVQGTEPRVEQVCPSAPRELVAICNKALARHPEQRFQSALEFRQALEAYLKTIRSEVTGERLAAFMQSQFSQDIMEMRQRIEEHLGNSRPMTSHATELTSPRQGASSSPAAAPTGANTRPSPWFMRPLVLSAAGLSVITAAAVYWTLSHTPPASSTVAVPGTASTSITPVASAVKVTERPRAFPSGQITVALAASPDTAVLRLDGRRISNPYRAAHGLDGAPHHFSAALAGYQSVERELVFDRDINESITLTTRTGSVKAAPNLPAPKLLSVGISPPARAAQSTGAPKVTTAVPASPPQPGEDLRANTTRAKARDIDETDPYKR